MGFHWQWYAIKRTGPGVVDEFLALVNLKPRQTLADRTLEEVDALEREREWGALLGSREYEAWTFLTGSALFNAPDVASAARALDADACFATADSTVWALSLDYAKPDGALRSRTFEIPVKAGEAPKVTVVIRKASDGPPTREHEGKEEMKGSPLPGELLDVPIADDVRLLKVLSSIGVPLAELMTRHIGTFDWPRLELIPGSGVKDRAFTAYVLGPPREPQRLAVPLRGAFLGRLLSR